MSTPSTVTGNGFSDKVTHPVEYRRIYVWELPVRVYHWINAVTLVVLCIYRLPDRGSVARFLRSRSLSAVLVRMGALSALSGRVHLCVQFRGEALLGLR